jgi:hypothetical protein
MCCRRTCAPVEADTGGYEPDGALDGLAALLTSRRLHCCLGGATFGLAAHVGPAVVLASMLGLAGVARPMAGFGPSASAFRIPCSPDHLMHFAAPHNALWHVPAIEFTPEKNAMKVGCTRRHAR